MTRVCFIGKTSLHAVLDYDDEEEESLDYYEETYSHGGVTPIQGPIFLRNGSVPVVPLYGYQKVSNGSLLQIPVSGFRLVCHLQQQKRLCAPIGRR